VKIALSLRSLGRGADQDLPKLVLPALLNQQRVGSAVRFYNSQILLSKQQQILPDVARKQSG
jgi:hypothetical protein